jgi:hypothetical protein
MSATPHYGEPSSVRSSGRLCAMRPGFMVLVLNNGLHQGRPPHRPALRARFSPDPAGLELTQNVAFQQHAALTGHPPDDSRDDEVPEQPPSSMLNR